MSVKRRQRPTAARESAANISSGARGASSKSHDARFSVGFIGERLKQLTRRWDRFWFTPETATLIARVRGALCLLAACYFLVTFPSSSGNWPQAEMWYGPLGLNSTARVAAFVRSAGVQAEARWYLSPLFMTDSVLVHQAFVVLGVVLAALVAAGRGRRITAFALWAVLVSVANRALYLGGLAETLLSLSLFAAAIAPPAAVWLSEQGAERTREWSAGFARKLIAVQISLVAIATTATMLAGSVWWNGYGAQALAAPVADRTFDWTDGLLEQPLIRDLLTLSLVLLLPLGVVAAWRPGSSTLGRCLIGAWCVVVALLSSFWLYVATFAVMAAAIDARRNERYAEKTL